MSPGPATAPPAADAEPDRRLIGDALRYLRAVSDYIAEPPYDTAGQAAIDHIAGELTTLARHYLNDKQAEHERSLPAWRCRCFAPYKLVIHQPGTEISRHEFYYLGENPPAGALCAGASQPASDEDCPHDSCAGILFPPCTLGSLAGQVRWWRGKVRDSGRCPACGVLFADALAGPAAR